MFDIVIRILAYMKRKIISNKYQRGFRKKIKVAPIGCDLNENILAFRYLCHQLEKTIKNKYEFSNIRGYKKYLKAIDILRYLENTKWTDSPDIEWGRNIIRSYELWKEVKYQLHIESYKKMEIKTNTKSFEDIIYQRRSVRFWQDEKIPIQKIMKIIEFGIMAPSSCNRQPYKFVIIENVRTKPKIEGTGSKAMIAKAPYIIYITIDRRLHPEKYAPAIDAGMAAQNILLAIEYFGYGACVMYHCEPVNQKKLRKVLKLDRHNYIYLAIPFGVPAEKPSVPTRVPAEKITKIIRLNSAELSCEM
jgi:nitroreductase